MILKSLVVALAIAILWVSATDADVVTDWNVLAINATTVGVPNSAAQSRTLAITHAAVFDAVNAIERRYAPYAVDTSAPPGASMEAAAAAASTKGPNCRWKTIATRSALSYRYSSSRSKYR